jgi:nitroimidazol reductase NimA-like FMN-containing flavoprotein (pyridoxamine 5'-phosphate oxidase superfamily)
MPNGQLPYHTRHPEKAIIDRAEILALARGARFVTLALCRGGEPYITAVNHVLDEAGAALWFHCAPEGRKLDFIRANPQVWGQALEDRGYVEGECEHAYRSAHFAGRAELVEDAGEKRHALEMLIDRHEPDPGPVKARLLQRDLAKVGIVRVNITDWFGKTGG